MVKLVGRGGGLLFAAAGVIAVFCTSLPAPTGVSAGQPTKAVRNVADHVGDGNDRDTGERSDRPEPALGGPGQGVLGADLAKPREAVNGLVGTVNQGVASPNRLVLESDPQDVGAGQSADFELSCPAPFKVVNGGSSGTDRPVRLTASYPVTTATGSAWHVRVRNDDNTTRRFRVNADCINGLTQYQRVTHLNRELAPGDEDEEELRCPAGTRALGGGYSLEMSDEVAVSASAPWGHDWLVHWRNIGSSPSRISIYAVCAAGVQSRVSGGNGSYGNEYEYAEFKCENGEGVTLAGGWRVIDTTHNKYIIVTQAYPGPNNNHVVWAHNHNGSYFFAEGICGTVP